MCSFLRGRVRGIVTAELAAMRFMAIRRAVREAAA